MQDWSGTRHDAFGTRLWWNWQLDAAQYPGWNGLVAELNASGTKVLTYINPYLADNAARAAKITKKVGMVPQSRKFSRTSSNPTTHSSPLKFVSST